MRSRAAFALAIVASSAVLAQTPAGDSRETNPFVVSYRCDRGNLAVAYPAYRDAATEPIRLAWQGRTYVMRNVRSGSGARYLTRNGQLEWWTKGNEAFLAVPGVNDKILDNCLAF